MLIAQITDLHVTNHGRLAAGGVDTVSAVAAAIDHLNGLSPAPDLVVMTGDLINGPRPGEYAVLAELLAPLRLPHLVIPGNHDDRAGMRDCFGHLGVLPPAGEYLHYVHDVGGLRILALDTIVPGVPEGLLDPPRLAWIRDRLEETPADQPVLVLMHHPPFVSGIANMDRMNCAGAPHLEALLRGRNVVGILCGHIHRPITAPFAGTIAFCGPSPSFAMALDLHADSEARWTREPPAIALHRWDPAHGLRTHISVIGGFERNRFR